MKKFFMALMTFFFVTGCTSSIVPKQSTKYGPYTINNPYGSKVAYGEGLHPGVDFGVPIGTPVISASDGEVIAITEADKKAPYGGGLIIALSHGDSIISLYVHLSEIFVEDHQIVKRGQLIGFSGASNKGWAHLHFGICKKGGGCNKYSRTFDPGKFWLGGQPQCYDLSVDYTVYSQKEITLPLACGDYATKLISEIKK